GPCCAPLCVAETRASKPLRRYGLPIPWPLPVVTVARASTLTQEGETMRGRLAVLIAAELLALLPMNSPGVSEATKRCTVADLNGTYVFTATGFGTPPGGSSPTAPKAIIEVISFNGDGTVDMTQSHTEREWHDHQREPGELRHLHRRYVDCGWRMHGNP